MKKLIITAIMILGFSEIQSQIIEDYPFKTYLDNDNYLYLTGNEQISNSKDIYIAKYPPANGSGYWKYQFPN